MFVTCVHFRDSRGKKVKVWLRCVGDANRCLGLCVCATALACQWKCLCVSGSVCECREDVSLAFGEKCQ